MGEPVPEPTELIVLPRPSWLPMFTALGLGLLAISTFKGWPYAVVGAVFVLVAVRRWIGETIDDVNRLPRRQQLTTAVLPAEPLRREAPPSPRG